MPKQLGIDDIVAHVEATEGWYLDLWGGIRRRVRGLCMCPISSAAGDGAGSVWEAAERLGLDDDSAGDIIEVGDTFLDELEMWGYEDRFIHLRRRLLAAAKLTEVEDG